MNIIDLLQADGIQAEHASRGEWHSPCPECGGDDRFSCWPEKVNSNGRYMGGRFVCRGCGFNGDAVNYQMKRRGLSFRDACKALEIEPGQMPEHRTGRRAWQPEPPKAAPGAEWQARARAFMEHCAGRLQHNSGAVEWLQAERGLNAETISRAGLGWNPVDVYQSRESWGLPPEVNSKGKIKMVWLPGGLVIPWRDSAGKVVRIRTRRSEPGQGARYVVAAGSGMGAMIQWLEQQAVCILESELDALLVHQQAGDLIGTVAMGSAQQKPDRELHERLMAAERVLICLDSDEAGQRAAWGHWRTYAGFKRWPVVLGKDVCEQWKAGVAVRTWITAGLS
jgi:DNA primase